MTYSKSIPAHQVGDAGPDSRGVGCDRADEGCLVSRSVESGGEGPAVVFPCDGEHAGQPQQSLGQDYRAYEHGYRTPGRGQERHRGKRASVGLEGHCVTSTYERKLSDHQGCSSSTSNKRLRHVHKSRDECLVSLARSLGRSLGRSLANRCRSTLRAYSLDVSFWLCLLVIRAEDLMSQSPN